MPIDKLAGVVKGTYRVPARGGEIKTRTSRADRTWVGGFLGLVTDGRFGHQKPIIILLAGILASAARKGTRGSAV